VYRSKPDICVRLGVHGAIADTEKTGFSSLFNHEEPFKIVEFGFDPELTKPMMSWAVRPPGNYP
jgi:hypothetical protein